MHGRLLVVPLLMLAGLAGCLGTSETPSDASDPNAEPAEETDEATGSPEAPEDEPSPSPSPDENAVPSASLEADVTEGVAPLTVNFTLDATDPEGDALTWAFDADGDGVNEAEGTEADLPRAENFTYEAAGLYNASLTVDDGQQAQDVLVTIEVMEAATPAALGQLVTVSWGPPANVGCFGPYDDWVFGTPLEGLTHAEFDVDATTYGMPFVIVFDIVGAVPGVFVSAIDFYDASDAQIGGTFETTDVLSGTVPDGAVHALVSDCGSDGEVSATYEAGAHVVVPE